MELADKVIMSKELENRFLEFARRVRDFCRLVKWDAINIEYIKQLIKASGSVAANYVEASDDLGKADEKMKNKNFPKGMQGIQSMAQLNSDA